MLNNFTRSKNKFKELVNTTKIFKTSDLYDEFLNLSNYFNNILRIEFEKIINLSLSTTSNKFLINVGDGTTSWIDIIDIIDDKSLELSKFVTLPSKSVLCTNSDGEFLPITCNIDYGVLFSRDMSTHIWRKILNEDIVDQTISGEQIDKLENLNLSDSLLNSYIVDDSIIGTDNIEDNSISSSKIELNTLTKDKLFVITDEATSDFIPPNYLDIGIDNLDVFSNNCITSEKIMEGTVDTKNILLFDLREYSDDVEYLHNSLTKGYEYSVNLNLLEPEILESFNILPECLEDEHLIPYQNIGNLQNIPWYDNYKEPRYFQQGYIAPKDDCRVEGRCLPIGQLRLRHFDNEVRQALINKGVTDDD